MGSGLYPCNFQWAVSYYPQTVLGQSGLWWDAHLQSHLQPDRTAHAASLAAHTIGTATIKTCLKQNKKGTIKIGPSQYSHVCESVCLCICRIWWTNKPTHRRKKKQRKKKKGLLTLQFNKSNTADLGRAGLLLLYTLWGLPLAPLLKASLSSQENLKRINPAAV